MKYAFLGDTAFLDGSEKIDFSNIIEVLKESKMVINLESIFEENGKKYRNIKNKISLKQSEDKISILENFNPFLINTSNNHSNDCGNQGINFTRQLLDSKGMTNFGTGYSGAENNLYINEQNKILFMSFTTRETDLTGSILWGDEKVQGPKNIDLEQIRYIKQKHHKYKIIVLMHWGLEHQNYPHPDIRKLGKNIIDHGADLIIGSHSHVIQGFEKYRGKYIFYSLGNFILNDIKYKINGNKNIFYQYPRSQLGIIPVIEISQNSIYLNKILTIKRGKDKYSISNYSMKKYNIFFQLNDKSYKVFFILYSKLNLFRMVYELKIYQLIRKLNEK